jgi:hypothetical protein
MYSIIFAIGNAVAFKSDSFNPDNFRLTIDNKGLTEAIMSSFASRLDMLYVGKKMLSSCGK